MAAAASWIRAGLPFTDVRGGDACTARRSVTRGAAKRSHPRREHHCPAHKPTSAPAPQPGYGDVQAWYGRGEAPPPELPPTQKLPRSCLSLRTAHAGGPPSEGLPFKGRSSSCSFGLRTPLSDHHVPSGPGPLKYKIPEQVTRYGKAVTPSYSMGKRLGPTPLKDPSVPGPGEYSPEAAKPQRGPAFTLLGRSHSPASAPTASAPAPNQYCLPPCIGPKVPLKPYLGAVRFNGRPREDTSAFNKSPGPAQYALPSLSSYKSQAPRAPLTGQKNVPLASARASTPAPWAYSVERAAAVVQRRPPRFSFGVRHSAAAHTMKAPEDT